MNKQELIDSFINEPKDKPMFINCTVDRRMKDGIVISSDNSWHERGELPPVGVECEYRFANPAYGWTPIKVNYISENHAILACLSDGSEVHTDGFMANKFRPIK